MQHELLGGCAITHSQKALDEKQRPAPNKRTHQKWQKRYLKHALRDHKWFERHRKRSNGRKQNRCERILVNQLPNSAPRVPLLLAIIGLATFSSHHINPDATCQRT